MTDKNKIYYWCPFINNVATIKAVYNSAMSVCFNKDPDFLRREVFWGDNLPDLSQELFKV